MANNDDEAGWDSLVDELGLDEKAKPAPVPATPVVDDDFGGDVVNDDQGGVALYDPGPDAVADDEEDGEDEGPETAGDGAPGSEGDGTGKKKRRRRRRRKKKGPDGSPEGAAPGAAPVEGSQVVVVAEVADVDGVEQGDAPGEIEGGDDDEDDRIHSAVDDEMDEEAAAPRREWQVMTWNELVGKLYRPN